MMSVVTSPVEANAKDDRTEGLALPKPQLHEMLTRMLRIRLFEQEASRIRAAEIPGALHNSIGQEAEIVGACMALREDDYMTGNHRSHGHPIGKGIELAPLMAELLGKETGVCRGKGGSMHLAAFSAGSLGESGIVGAAIPAATGAALSAQLRGTDQVCLCFFGDGAANCGPFHEALNIAAVWKLPVIFLCENNGYAICSAQGQTTSVADIATRAAAYQMPGAVVDGQDVLAVFHTVRIAVARARIGNGPSLLETKTYRYCDHQEDCAFPVYRPSEEVNVWRKKDPISAFCARLRKTGDLNSHEFDEIEKAVRREVDEALAFARDSAALEPAALFEDLYL